MFEREIKKKKDTRQLPPGQKVIDKALRWGVDHPAIVDDIPKLDGVAVNRRWGGGDVPSLGFEGVIGASAGGFGE